MSQRLQPQRTGDKLLAIRQHLGLSQTGMKKRLNFKGHYVRISDYETGRRFPPVLTLLLYVRVTGIHLEDLVDDEVELNFGLCPHCRGENKREDDTIGLPYSLSSHLPVTN